MAKVVVTLTIMPASPESDLAVIEQKAKEAIVSFAGEGDCKVELKPVAFGLKSVNITFVMDEDKGSTEALEEEIAKVENVNSVEVSDVRRALG
jgi:elongation factor 1-beta